MKVTLQGWLIYNGQSYIDTVFYDLRCTQIYVLRDLIYKDKYPVTIYIEKEKPE